MSNTHVDELMQKLFKWKRKVLIADSEFMMRVVSDATVDDARKFALLESRKLRRQLRDQHSDEYLMYLDQIMDYSTDDIQALLVANATRKAAREYAQQNPRPVVQQLGDYPTQEEMELYEEAKERAEEDFYRLLQEYLNGWRANYLRVLETRNREQIESMYKALRVDELCEAEFSSTFEDYIVAHSLYMEPECKQRAFTYAEFKLFPTAIKEKLREEYNQLTLSGDELKN